MMACQTEVFSVFARFRRAPCRQRRSAERNGSFPLQPSLLISASAIAPPSGSAISTTVTLAPTCGEPPIAGPATVLAAIHKHVGA
jgi:hypothetical protein